MTMTIESSSGLSRPLALITGVGRTIGIGAGIAAGLAASGDIARRAGVRAGTIYNRFGGREGLLDAVVADVAAGWLRAVIDRAAGQGTAWGRFAAFVQGMCEEQAADPVFNDVFSRRYPDAPDLRAVCDQSLAFGAELIRDAESCGTLRPGFSADDLARIFSVNAYLVRDRPAGDDGWRRTLQFTLDGLRVQPDGTSE